MSIRAKGQCTAHTKAGHRCRIITAKVGPMCWIHTKSKLGVQVKPSKIKGAGLGLFATRKIPANTVIDNYRGQVLDQLEAERRHNIAYIFKVNKNKYIDAVKTNSGPARYANDCRSTAFDCNASLAVNPRQENVTLKVKNKPIPAGKEILASYGEGYWKKREAPKVNTARNKRAAKRQKKK